MTKFNKKEKESVKLRNREDATLNYEGGLAFKSTPKTELTLRFLTFLVGEPKFYTSGAKDTAEIGKLIKKVAQTDPEYIMKLAAYARNQMYLRSAPLFALVEGVSYENVRPFVKEYTPKIIRRADEINEALAYYITKNGQIGDGVVVGADSLKHGSLANSLKKGLAEAFHSFDEYQFAKYNRAGEVTFKDALRMVHPKPHTAEHSVLFKKILEDTLETPVTWEVVLSTMADPETGKTFKTKKEAWEFVIPKMGYMAKLRNLRNMLDADISDEVLDSVIGHLTNANAVKNSKQLPFRFYSAEKMIRGNDPFKVQKVKNAIETALELSVANMPKLKGRTYICADNSGSMRTPVSRMSDVQAIDVANLLTAMAHSISENGIASAFATSFGLLRLSPRDSVLTNMKKVADVGRGLGGGTDAWLVMDYLLKNNINVDRIFLLSDMQCYQTGRWGYHGDRTLANQFVEYKKRINPNAILYSWNLVGYDTLQFPENQAGVILLAGWSDRVFEFIEKYESFHDGSIIQEVENFE